MGAIMKAVLTSFAVLLLAAGVASHADAANQKTKRLHTTHYKKHYVPKATNGYRSQASGPGSDSTDYYEHVLEKVPFGSKRWWSIYEEQHGSPW
jgi:hypothetical protein